jgi:hypothetical protein
LCNSIDEADALDAFTQLPNRTKSVLTLLKFTAELHRRHECDDKILRGDHGLE